MRTDIDKTNRNRTSIIEGLLTAMSMTTILVGLLVPALNKARRHSYEVKQKVQMKGIGTGLEFFNTELKILSPKET
jgi:hypothetical protein